MIPDAHKGSRENRLPFFHAGRQKGAAIHDRTENKTNEELTAERKEPGHFIGSDGLEAYTEMRKAEESPRLTDIPEKIKRELISTAGIVRNSWEESAVPASPHTPAATLS